MSAERRQQGNERRDHAGEPPVADLLSEVINVTERHVREWETLATGEHAEFVRSVREHAPRWKSEEQVVEGLVRMSMPGWLRSFVASDQAWEKLVEEIVGVMLGHEPSRQRVLALWRRIPAPQTPS